MRATSYGTLFLATLVIWSGCNRSEPAGDNKTTQANPGQAPAAGAAKTPGAQPTASPSATPGNNVEAQTGAKTEAKTDVTLQLNWVPEPEFGGFYAAAHKGLYASEGLDVTITAGAAGIQTWNMVATGKVPFAIASAGEVLRARLKDADLVAIFAVYQTNPQAFMVHEGSGVQSLEEIFTSGKITTVAMEAGLPYGRYLKSKYGFDKVKVVQYGGNLTLFFQDPKLAQQCFIFSEPVTAREKNIPVKAFSVAESGFNPYLAVLITSESYLAEHAEVVAKFVRATRAGWQEYLDDPEPTNHYMKTQKASMSLAAMKISAELQMPYIVTEEARKNYLGYMSADRWRTLAEQLKELGEIDRVPDIAQVFRNIAAE